MLVKIPTPAQELSVGSEAPMPEPTISISREEVEARTGFSGGPTVVRIRVENTDGGVATFFVNLAVKNGRARAELVAKINPVVTRPGNSETRKTAFADWRL